MYSKTHWQDRVVDPETGEVVQEGTFMSAEHFNNMEDGIEANDTAISEISESVETIETTLDTGVGTTITLTVNSSTFVMKLALKNSEGDILSESEVDLPIESMIVNAEYVEATKSLVLTLQSGSKVTVPLSALINGLVNDTRKVAGMDLKKDITVAEMVTALGVDKKANKTSVSLSKEGGETTSVINVTDAKAQMAMVASIKGKTKKSKNLLKCNCETTTNGGVTFTVNKNSDGEVVSIDVNGPTASGSSVALIVSYNYQLFKGKNVRVFDGVQPSVMSHDKIHLQIWTDKNSVTSASGDAVVSTEATTGNVAVWLAGGTVFNHVKVYPMICLSTESETSKNTFEPYFEGLHSAPVESVVSVGKNRLAPYLYLDITSDGNTTCTRKGGTYLVNSSGAASKTASFRIASNVKVTSGMKISGCPTGGGSSAYELLVSDGTNTARDYGSGANITFNSDSAYVNIVVRSGATASNKEFKPMISVSGGEYAEPYETTVLVPSEARNCVGYGLGIDATNCNIADFENGVYYYNVEKYKLGSDAYVQMPETGLFFFTDFTSHGAALCSKYKFVDVNVENNAAAKSALNEGEFTYRHGSTNDRIYVKDSSIANSGDFRTKNVGMEFICTLPTSAKKTIPLTDFIRPLPVEQGGTLTLVNEHNLDVNSVIKYKKEV